MKPVQRFLAGDSQTVRQVQNWATQIVDFRWARLSHLREDLIQEILLSLCKTLTKDGFKLRNKDLKGLTQQIAMARCHEYWRKLNREQLAWKMLVPEHYQPRDRLDEERLRSLLRRALVLLELKHQRLIRMHEFEKFTYKKMSAGAGCPVGTMKSRLRASKMALKQTLAITLMQADISWLEAQEVSKMLS